MENKKSKLDYAKESWGETHWKNSNGLRNNEVPYDGSSFFIKGDELWYCDETYDCNMCGMPTRFISLVYSSLPICSSYCLDAFDKMVGDDLKRLNK